jgi:phenylacetate-CoA ligase
MINQYFHKHLVYLPIATLKTKHFLKNFYALKLSQFKTEDEIRSIQAKKLIKLLAYATKNVPAYKGMENTFGYKSDDIDKILNTIPFTLKDDIKKNFSGYISKENFYLLTKKTTGGSTGQPVTILKTREAMGFELAATWRGYSWAGIDIGDKQARFWGVPFSNFGKFNAWLTDKICNRIRLSAFSFNDDCLMAYSKKIEQFKPDYFYGYVSMLCDYARFCSNKLDNISITPRCIITTAEVLTSRQKKILQSVFKTKVYNEYGCGELGTIAHECEHGNMHISAENMIVEILDGNRICEDGELGEIVVTELNNLAMPLIRYRLGDYASISAKACKCGRQLPILNEVKGREYDTITLANGKKIHGEYFMYIMEASKKKDLGVGKFQIIQKNLFELQVKVVPEKTFNLDSEKFIRQSILSQFDEKIDINIELVDQIPREKSGKMRLVVAYSPTSKK